jgi:hypothetical protein
MAISTGKLAVHTAALFCTNPAQTGCLNAHKSLIYNNFRAYKAHSTTVENIRQSTPIMQNKPNFPKDKICTKAVLTRTYKTLPALPGEKTNPIQTRTKPTQEMTVNTYLTALYMRKPPSGGRKNRPNTNPISFWPQFSISSVMTSK